MNETSEAINKPKEHSIAGGESKENSHDDLLKKESHGEVLANESHEKLSENDIQQNVSEKESQDNIFKEDSKMAKSDGHELNDYKAASGSQDHIDENDKASEDEQILKKGTVNLQGVNRILQLTSKFLILNIPAELPAKNVKRHREALVLPWQWVIWAELNSQVTGEEQRMNMTIHYMLKEKKKLRTHCIHLTSVEEKADAWIDIIQDQCKKVEGRPKRVLVVVNPIGGAGNARQLYQRKVAPIFHLAHIEADVICTERSKHALEIGENQDLSSYSGVIVVGGDGLYQELLQGITIQRQKAAGIDYNNVNSKFVPLDIPVGIIPAGTGNGVSSWLNSGVKDIETAALRVLTGEIHKGQVFTVHSNGKFFCICGLLFGYGSFGDMIKRTDELRWMKRARYPYCMLSFLLKKRRQTQCAVEYLVAPDSQTNKLSSADSQDSHADGQWIKHDAKGKDYVGIFSFVACPVDKGDHTIINPFADRIRLFLDTGCSTINLTKSLLFMVTGRKSEVNIPNMDMIDNVQGVRIRIVKDGSEDPPQELTGAAAKARELEHYIDIDGECLVLESVEMDIRVVPSFVPLCSCNCDLK